MNSWRSNEVVEDERAVVAAEQRVAQARLQDPERAGAYNEVADVGGQPVEQRRGEVHPNQPAADPRTSHQPAALGQRASGGREMEHLQAGDPTVGVAPEAFGVGAGQWLTVMPVEQLGDLPRTQAQVLLAQRPRAGTEQVAGEPDSGSAGADHDEAHVSRRHGHRPGQQVLCRRTGEVVRVVDDHSHVGGLEKGEQGVGVGVVRLVQPMSQGDRRGQMPRHRGGGRVRLVCVVPRHLVPRPATAHQIGVLRDERGLARAGRGGEEEQSAVALVEYVQQAPADKATRGRGGQLHPRRPPGFPTRAALAPGRVGIDLAGRPAHRSLHEPSPPWPVKPFISGLIR